jgi:hypothetical protein
MFKGDLLNDLNPLADKFKKENQYGLVFQLQKMTSYHFIFNLCLIKYCFGINSRMITNFNNLNFIEIDYFY